MLKEIFKNRELLWELVRNDIEVRYRYPLLGFLWAFLMPSVLIFMFLIVFSYIIKAEIKDLPYSIYLITGIFPWSYFQSTVLQATTSIPDNASLIKKVYFPRSIIPFSVIISNQINFLICIGIILIVLPIFGIKYSILIIFLPFVILMQILFTIGFSLFFSSLYVRFRDMKYIAEILLIIFFYLSPGFYPLDFVIKLSENFFKLYLLNPFVGMISLYRVVMINNYIKTLPNELTILKLVVLPFIASIFSFFLGIFIFKKFSNSFTDHV